MTTPAYNVMLSAVNLADAATLSAGTWLAGFPLSRLQTADMTEQARSNGDGTAATQLLATWASAQTLRVISLWHHNLSAAATVRIRLENNSGGKLYDTADTANPLAIPVWYTGSQPATADLAVYPARHFFHVLPADVPGVYKMYIYISDTSNPDNYVQAGRLWAGAGWQPSRNMAYGGQVVWVPQDGSLRADKGALALHQVYKYRTCRFSLSWLTPDDGRAAFHLAGLLGVGSQAVFIADPSDTASYLQTAFPARLAQLSSLEWVRYNQNSMAFDVEELIPGSA